MAADNYYWCCLHDIGSLSQWVRAREGVGRVLSPVSFSLSFSFSNTILPLPRDQFQREKNNMRSFDSFFGRSKSNPGIEAQTASVHTRLDFQTTKECQKSIQARIKIRIINKICGVPLEISSGSGRKGFPLGSACSDTRGSGWLSGRQDIWL